MARTRQPLGKDCKSLPQEHAFFDLHAALHEHVVGARRAGLADPVMGSNRATVWEVHPVQDIELIQ